MTRRKRSTTIVKAFVSRSLIFALSAGAVHAADLPNPRWLGSSSSPTCASLRALTVTTLPMRGSGRTRAEALSVSRDPQCAEVLGFRGCPRIVRHSLLVRAEEGCCLPGVTHLFEHSDEPTKYRRLARQPPVQCHELFRCLLVLRVEGEDRGVLQDEVWRIGSLSEAPGNERPGVVNLAHLQVRRESQPAQLGARGRR